MNPRSFLESVYVALVEFAQEFMCRALHLCMRWPVELTPAEPGFAEAFAGKEHAQFIEWQWSMNGSPMRAMFDAHPHVEAG